MSHLKLNSCQEHYPPLHKFPIPCFFLTLMLSPSSMFSSILPSSNVKFVQNGPPKVSFPASGFTVLSLMNYTLQNPSRFSVRVFRTPVASAFHYPMAAKVDPGYRSVQQSEQQRYVPRYGSSSSPMLGLIENSRIRTCH